MNKHTLRSVLIVSVLLALLAVCAITIVLVS